MNLDTDMQWAFWDGVHDYYKDEKTTCMHSWGIRKVMTNQTKIL